MVNITKFVSGVLFSVMFSVASAKELVIALGNFEPLFAAQGKPSLFKDLIDGVYSYIPDTHISYRYLYSNARLVHELNALNVDGAANIFFGTTIKGCLTQPVFAYSDVAISVKSADHEIKSIADLSKVTVVSYQGATVLLGEIYHAAVIKSNYYTEVPKPEEQAKLLLAGMVDVSVGDKYIFLHSLQAQTKGRYTLDDFQIHDIFPLVESSMGFNDINDCHAFDNALVKFKQSGQYQQVYQRHLQRLGYLAQP
jgi:polar amino acid transport system substrate-binding protein